MGQKKKKILNVRGTSFQRKRLNDTVVKERQNLSINPSAVSSPFYSTRRWLRGDARKYRKFSLESFASRRTNPIALPRLEVRLSRQTERYFSICERCRPCRSTYRLCIVLATAYSPIAIENSYTHACMHACEVRARGIGEHGRQEYALCVWKLINPFILSASPFIVPTFASSLIVDDRILPSCLAQRVKSPRFFQP